MTRIAMLSGGQDSTAMTLRLFEIGQAPDHVVFCDTLIEHDEMYEYIDKIDAFLQRRYGVKIDRTKPSKSFEAWVFGKVTSGDNNGKVRGTPMVTEPCYWRREAKERAFDRWVKERVVGEHVKLIGYTVHERERAEAARKHGIETPLIDWGWREIDCRNYLREREMENKLYRHFSRTGCAVCPRQKIDDFYAVWKYYPKWYEYMIDVEERLIDARLKNGEKDAFRPAWHTKYTTGEMAELFRKKEMQPSLPFEEEPTRDCFCRI